MNNDIMIDSSLLVEYVKKTRMSLLNRLINDSSATCYINETVVSEFLFYHLKLNSAASPRSAKSSNRIKSIIESTSDYNLLYLFHFLSTDKKIYGLAPQFMSQYNILPNDAIILATCKIHGIVKLASHDSDFIIPCQQEGIELVMETE